MMNTLIKSTSVLAFAALMSAGSAQACMFGIPFQSTSPACSSQVKPEACPAQGASDSRAPACAAGREDMMNAMGSMAVGGMEMAATMMRALAVEVDKRIEPNPGI